MRVLQAFMLLVMTRAMALAMMAALPVVSVAQESACEPYVEMQGESARLRPHLDAFVTCVIDEETYAKLVSGLLSPESDGGFSAQHMPQSIALGRLEELPWLSRALIDAALADSGWSKKRGKARNEQINSFVARLLMSSPIRERLAAPLQGSGYTITGASVEKVLVRALGDAVPGAESPAWRVPVDAQVWLRIGAVK